MVDLTAVIVATIGGFLSIVSAVFLYWLKGHMTDQQAAMTLGNAVTNALGAMQQVAEGAVEAAHPSFKLPESAPPNMASGVQYVLNHAGEEAARLGITTQAIADKINAKIGLTHIQANLAVASSSDSSMTPAPMGPVPVS